MSNLKEIEGRYFKECNVVMLPDTNEINYSRICFRKETNEFRFDAGIGVHNLIKIGFRPQHLYITSSDKIKEGDWCILDYERVIKIKEIKFRDFSKTTTIVVDSENLVHSFNLCKKVIATTDRDIEESKILKNIIQKATKIASKNVIKPKVVRDGKIYKKSLKSIPIDFIKAYCEQEGINKVLAEYEKITVTSLCQNCSPELPPIKCTCNDRQRVSYEYKLKTDSHNTITIKPMDSKITEQHFRNFIRANHLTSQWDNWIKENL